MKFLIALFIQLALLSCAASPAWCLVCDQCKELGMKSKIHGGWGEKTLMGFETYYDEDGKFHSHDPNKCTSTYTCSNNHRFTIKWITPCKSCDYGHGVEQQTKLEPRPPANTMVVPEVTTPLSQIGGVALPSPAFSRVLMSTDPGWISLNEVLKRDKKELKKKKKKKTKSFDVRKYVE